MSGYHDQWYPRTSWLGGFNPKASGCWAHCGGVQPPTKTKGLGRWCPPSPRKKFWILVQNWPYCWKLIFSLVSAHCTFFVYIWSLWKEIFWFEIHLEIMVCHWKFKCIDYNSKNNFNLFHGNQHIIVYKL